MSDEKEEVQEKLDSEIFYPEAKAEEEVEKVEEVEEKPEVEADEKSKEEEPEKKEEVKEEIKEGEPVLEFTSKDLKVPEDSVITGEEVERIAETIKKQGLSKDVAQLVIDEKTSAIEALEARQVEDFGNLSQQWLEETKADPLLGGDKLPETTAKAQLFMDKYATPEFKKIMDEGYINHKEIVRVFANVGADLQSDSDVSGGVGSAGSEKEMKDYFYGN